MREELIATAEIPQLEKTVGADGRERPATQPERPTAYRYHDPSLDESQRAMVAAKIATLPKGANQHTAPANLPT